MLRIRRRISAITLMAILAATGCQAPRPGQETIDRPWDSIYGLAQAPGGGLLLSGKGGFIAGMDGISGKGLRTYGRSGTGPGQLRSAFGLAVDAEGRILFVDQRNSRLVRMDDLSGAGWTSFEFGSPELLTTGLRGLGLGGDGRIYLTDEERGRLIRMDDISGKNLETLGQPGRGVGEFMNPCGVCTDARGRIYVADSGNDRIVRIEDFSGRGWTSYGESGTGPGQFTAPYFVAIDPKGRILVSDSHGGRIVRFDDMTGAGWIGYAPPEGGAGRPLRPAGVMADEKGRVWFLDQPNRRLVRIDDMDGKGMESFEFSW